MDHLAHNPRQIWDAFYEQFDHQFLNTNGGTRTRIQRAKTFLENGIVDQDFWSAYADEYDHLLKVIPYRKLQERIASVHPETESFEAPKFLGNFYFY